MSHKPGKGFTGMFHSEETKRRISIANKGKTKGKPKSFEHRMRIARANRKPKPWRQGVSLSSEHRAAILAAHKRNGVKPPSFFGKRHNAYTRFKMSRSASARIARGNGPCKTNIELKTELFLIRSQISYLYQYLIDGHCVDFFLPDFNMVIECDGEYWHSLSGRKESDAKRTLKMEQLGYTVVRIPESSIEKGDFSDVASRIS